MDIKPCPFCGGRQVDAQEGSSFRWMVAFCCNCGATCGEVRVQTLGEGTREQWISAARIRAIEEWNTRESDLLQRKVE
jgi:hypothetical protein